MAAIKRILCPTDFSEFSSHALEQAVLWARWYGAEITVLHVCTASVAAFAAPDAGAVLPDALLVTAHEHQRLEAELRSFAEPFCASVPTVQKTSEGNVLSGILDEARTLPADLIVMGTHGRSGFTRMLLGSITERVLRQADCPVLTVPRKVAAARQPAVPRVLCPIDFSESSLRALRYAAVASREANAELIVLHVIELLPEAATYGHGVVDLAGHYPEIRETARGRLAAAIADAAADSPRVTEMVEVGRPYREILRVAWECRADLIVIGVHGRGSADLMIFGSTTQQVVRQASAPVLTLRART